MNIIEMEKLPLVELRQQAKEHEIPRAGRLKKEDLIMKIRQAEAEKLLEEHKQQLADARRQAQEIVAEGREAGEVLEMAPGDLDALTRTFDGLAKRVSALVFAEPPPLESLGATTRKKAPVNLALPLGMALMTLRFLQVGWSVLIGETEVIIACHEAESEHCTGEEKVWK